MTNAKKAYRDYRKNKIAEVKRQHKEIKRKHLSKIRRMPQADRAEARKQLNAQLKKREADLKSRLPSKISPEQMQKLFGNGIKKV